ncbi:MAG: hypothetical protein AAGU11_12565 [Syntrophobacteraceae bacterium]
MNLRGYRGKVTKTAKVYCNDPRTSRTTLAMYGSVKPLIDIRPSDTVSFRGMAGKLQGSDIELIGESVPFHVTKIENSLDDKVSHQLETIEDGKHYRLRLTNLLRRGSYSGYVILHTDLAQRGAIRIRVIGSIEGESSVNPKTLFVGKLSARQPVRSGKVTVVGSSGKPFKITRIIHDHSIKNVKQEPLPDQSGFSLEIVPNLKAIPPGSRKQSVVSIETDLPSDGVLEVQVQVFHSAEVL